MVKLSEALKRVYQVTQNHIVRSEDVSRADREVLVRGRWLQPIVRGWYLLVRPDVPEGETSPWYASFWDFISLYLKERYQDDYCLCAENSLDLHLKIPTIPKQVIAIAKKGNNSPLKLPFETSLLIYADPSHIPEEVISIKGIKVMSLPLALCRVSPSYFLRCAKDAEIALRLIKDPSELAYIILRYDFKKAAGRLIGAYQFLQEKDSAAQLQTLLEKEHFFITIENPFQEERAFLDTTLTSPTAARIFILWQAYRDDIIKIFPEPSSLKDKKTYFAQLEKVYVQDAYNSLSIEGYQVSQALIKHVIEGDWDPSGDKQDQKTLDGLAAFGYYQAFSAVKVVIASILEGQDPVTLIKENLHQWMRNLFQPMVSAGIVRSEDLVGYRRSQVYIRGSRHIPVSKEEVSEAMQAFYECLKNEPHPAVRAVLGHFLFVYIHPYMDGNGRTARFLMNAMLASGGYPWIIIEVKNRDRYFAALESASVGETIKPLAEFIKEEMLG